MQGSVAAGQGVEVVLHSLSAAELNGRRGQITTTGPNQKGRWEVRVQEPGGEARTVALKLGNLLWVGRQVQLGQDASAGDFSGVAGLVTSLEADDQGRWSVEARKVLALKPDNLEPLAQAAGSPGALKQGSHVRVHGLQSASATGYNGLEGSIKSKSPNEQGRWEVEVQRTLPLKLDSLKLELPWAAALFGETLLTKSGLRPTDEVLGGRRAVLVYFSAHWCPPCRGFTPVLAAAYAKSGGAAEVVFVSSDQDAAGFEGYYREMPWTAVPFADQSRKAALSAKFGVRGIPHLAVLRGTDGSLVSANGRGEVQASGDLDRCLSTWGC